MKTFTNEDLKNMLSSTNYGENSVLEIGDGFNIVSSMESVLEENQVSLHECVFWFSGNFNEEAVDIAVKEANDLIKD